MTPCHAPIKARQGMGPFKDHPWRPAFMGT